MSPLRTELPESMLCLAVIYVTLFLNCANRSFQLHFPQAPSCVDGKRPKRDTNSFDDGQPATIEVYSGLYVNENAEIIEGGDDSVFAEKVSVCGRLWQLD